MLSMPCPALPNPYFNSFHFIFQHSSTQFHIPFNFPSPPLLLSLLSLLSLLLPPLIFSSLFLPQLDSHQRRSRHDSQLQQQAYELSLAVAMSETERMYMRDKVARDEALLVAQHELKQQALQRTFAHSTYLTTCNTPFSHYSLKPFSSTAFLNLLHSTILF